MCKQWFLVNIAYILLGNGINSVILLVYTNIFDVRPRFINIIKIKTWEEFSKLWIESVLIRYTYVGTEIYARHKVLSIASHIPTDKREKKHKQAKNWNKQFHIKTDRKKVKKKKNC